MNIIAYRIADRMDYSSDEPDYPEDDELIQRDPIEAIRWADMTKIIQACH